MNVRPRSNCNITRLPRLFVCAIMPLGCGVAGDAFAVTPATFFKPPKQARATLDPTGIYPYGQQFGFGLYSISGNSKVNPQISNMHRVAESGFTLAGPYYEKDWRDFRPIYAAANEGLKFTFQIRPPQAVEGVTIDKRPAAIDKLTDAQITASVREQVLAVLNDPVASNTVARWSLSPEELRYWSAPELRYLKVASAAIQAVEKERGATHRPMWMYEPGHRTSAALKKTGIYQDIVSKGLYLTNMNRGLERSAHAIWSYTQIVDAAKSLKTTPQAVLQLSQDFADPKTGKKPEEIRRVLRHDAYLGLVKGIKSVNVWSMTENRANFTTHNDQFQAYASVAQDLTGDLDLQQAFLFGEPRNDLKIKITNGVKDVSYTDLEGVKFKFDTLHYLNTAVGADRYLLLVNSTEQTMDLNITGLPTSFWLDDLFAGTTKEIRQPSLNYRLDVLGVSALRFRQIGAANAGGLGLRVVPEPSAGILTMLAVFCVLGSSRRTFRRSAHSS